MTLSQQLEKEQVAKLSAGKEIPDVGPGDTVLVNYKVVEGERTRIQAYEGVCIGRAGSGLERVSLTRSLRSTSMRAGSNAYFFATTVTDRCEVCASWGDGRLATGTAAAATTAPSKSVKASLLIVSAIRRRGRPYG